MYAVDVTTNPARSNDSCLLKPLIRTLAITTVAPDTASSLKSGTTVYLSELLQGLLRVGHVHLVSPGAPTGAIEHAERLTVTAYQPESLKRLARFCRALTTATKPAWWEQGSDEVRGWLAKIDPTSFDQCVFLGESATVFADVLPRNLPKICIRHNLDSVSIRQTMRMARWVGRVRGEYHCWLMHRFDKWSTRDLDCILTCTREMARYLKPLSCGTPISDLPIMCRMPIARSHERQDSAKTLRGVFVGTFGYGPNAGAVSWFITAVAPLLSPLLREKIEFVFVGRDPPLDLLSSVPVGVKIRFTGFIDDLDTLLAEADFGFVPLQGGSGIKMKTLAMLAAGLPIVSTSHGIEGLDLKTDYDCLIADTPKAFAAALAAIIDGGLRKRLSVAASRSLGDCVPEHGFKIAFSNAALAAKGQALRRLARRPLFPSFRRAL